MNLFNDIFSYIFHIIFQQGAIITPALSVDDKKQILDNAILQDNSNFYCKQLITINNITTDTLNRYYDIVKMYQTKHYWLGLYNPPNKLTPNSLILFHKAFIPGIYETSIMRVIANTDDMDDFTLIFQSTDTSLIDGYYKWHFVYNNDTITLEYIKQGVFKANDLGQLILSKQVLTTINDNIIKQDLEALRNYIVNNIKNHNLQIKLNSI
jgi:hypothetical protein